MQLREKFKAWGHPNITASHRTTIMVTREPDVTLRGDCIVAVAAEKGLRDLDPRVKEAMRSRDAGIRLILQADGLTFQISGRGDPRLTLSHPTDIVTRRSSYVCDRTLMIGADKAANDIEPRLVRMLQRREQVVNITLVVDELTSE
jgi:hypothetical protein